MKSKFFICFLFLVSLFYNNHLVYANDFIKVALISNYKDISELTLNNKFLLIGNDLNNSIINLNSKNNFVLKIDNNSYSTANENFSNYDQAKEALNLYKQKNANAVICYTSNNNFKIFFKNQNGYNFVENKPRLQLQSDNETIILDNDNNLYIKSIENDFLNLNNKKYRGSISFEIHNSSFTVINTVDIEEYLYSVVSSEMSPSWNEEALKAQAIASRSYTEFNKNASNNKNYEFYDNDSYQVYTGVNGESPQSILAVDSTKGIMAYYGGKVINATFFSSSGGNTENSEDIWLESEPYLKGIEDPYEKEYLEWERVFSFEEIKNALKNKGIDIGDITNIKISDLNNNRVNKLTIVGTKGTYTLEKENIRTFFNFSKEGSLKSRNFIISNTDNKKTYNNKIFILSKDDIYDINSENIFMLDNKNKTRLNNNQINVQTNKKVEKIDFSNLQQNINDTSNIIGNKIIIKGKGWGHGVGMSQYGAKNMAELGFNFEQILKFYYKDIEVR